MSYWSFIFVVLSLAYLAYRDPKTVMNYLPHWLRPSSQLAEGVPDHESKITQAQQPPAPKITVEQDGDEEVEITPKATPARPDTVVPTLTLDGVESDDVQQAPTQSTGSSTPSKPATSMLPPPKPKTPSMPPPPKPKTPTTASRTNGLMLPPSKPALAPPASSASALRIPSTGPLPNRGPPANSQQRASGGLTVNGTKTAPNPRGKVLLAPGHSPMDWAALTRRDNLSGVATFQRVTPSQLKSMTGRKGKPAWSSWQGKVYNITPYLDFHPGGKGELMKAAGRDGTKAFMDVHPWVNWENMLGTCMVGVMVPESMGTNGDDEGLEGLD